MNFVPPISQGSEHWVTIYPLLPETHPLHTVRGKDGRSGMDYMQAVMLTLPWTKFLKYIH